MGGRRAARAADRLAVLRFDSKRLITDLKFLEQELVKDND
jgi:hypothetical protein